MNAPSLSERLGIALANRQHLFDADHTTAFRLFNGFGEGCPDLAIDLYGDTLLIHNYADPPEQGDASVLEAASSLRKRLPWVGAVILKTRNSPQSGARRGQLLIDGQPADKVQENGIWYAVNLTLNRDASFYLDTRNLRAWVHKNAGAKSVLNAFAYTGSLGIAALAGGAARVVQLDRNRQFLDLAEASRRLNALPARAQTLIRADFFRYVGRLRRERKQFDCVIIDPPFFASADTGTVDQVHDSARLINKVRPLVRGGGSLVAVNNALYVSGAAYMQTLESLCADGYLRVEAIIPVPEDFVGIGMVGSCAPITDPAPFNHSTKIAVLRSVE